ncbi:CotH kinase family protein [Paenibacillus sp. NEAU-GSW1]|uniref:CotH kinase family protein n=1 Tax=Paenibacillus sp. NEAU-GSW1 TaxID=2682486 RepID=UPI0012E0F28D|nr:CotH kinase family protein [Paenibacillus sp. NEAU-GSW1]MUT65901.1 spore coat protein CotH [Paenibacillus sp. NEAU-GSW1]
MEQFPVRKITIDEEDMMELQQAEKRKKYKTVQLEMDGKTYTAQFGFRGGHTLHYSKKSYEVIIEGGTTLHWNAEFDDPSMIRNALSFHFFNMIGIPSPLTKHIWVEINGKAQGVYLEIEAVNTYFFKKRKLGINSIVYATNDSADFSLVDPDSKEPKNSLFEGYEIQYGTTTVTKPRLIRFIKGVNRLSGKKLSAYTAKKLDVNQYLLWLAGAVLTGNYDGFDQNYALYEHRKSGKYRIIPWDYEGTWGRNCYGRPCGSNLVRLQGYNKLTEKLFAYSSCRKAYKAIMYRVLKNHFTVERIDPVIVRMYQQLTPAIRDDFTRKSSFDTFLNEPAFILDYVRERRAVIKTALKAWKA